MGSEILRARVAGRGGELASVAPRYAILSAGERHGEKLFRCTFRGCVFFHTPMSDFSRANVVDAVRFGVVKLASMRSVGD